LRCSPGTRPENLREADSRDCGRFISQKTGDERYLSPLGPILLFTAFLLIIVSQSFALEVPKLTGYVNDYGGMISPQVKSQIENELSSFEKSDSTQVVILTIPSLEGAVLEEFAIKAGEAWKIGQKGKDNGVIIVVSKGDKKIRIEVGRGLEGKLTDLMAGRIIDLVIKPRFKRGDYDGGLHAGVAAIIDASRGEFKAEPARRQQKRGSSSLFTFLIIAAVAVVVLGSINRKLGAAGGAVALPLSVLLSTISVGVMWLAILGVVGLILGLLLPMLFGGGRGGGGGFGGGGFYGGGGGFSSGGSSGGSDFGGGGGGDFGGGGSSGDW
jgi:uncharacterized protein